LSLSGLFNIGKSALFASQTALSVIGHNIANVNTPSFSRQEAVLSSATSTTIRNGLLGGGVIVSDIKRDYDSFIQSQLLGQYQNYGRSSSLNETFSQIEQIFNEAGDMGLAIPLMDYFNAWHDVSTNPEGQAQRTVLLQKASALVLNAKQMEQGILDNLRNTNGEISDIVERVNSIASKIAELNVKIVQTQGSSLSSVNANDLRDQRDSLLNDLANLVEFTSYENKDGSVTVSVGMRNLVSEDNTNTLSTRTNENGDKDLYLDGVSITSQIQRGQLGGLISVRDHVESNSLKGLRKLVASITKEINILHTAGYGLDGTTGNDFFNPLQISLRDFSPGADITASITNLSQVTLNEYSVTFDSLNNYHVINNDTGVEVTSGAYVSGNPITFDGIQITITGAITSADSFSISPLTDAIKNFGVAVSDYQKIAAAGSDITLPGDNTIALSIAQLSDNTIADLGNSTFMSFYSGLVSDVGSMNKAASDSLKFDNNLLSEMNNMRESISGVSLDEEATNLIRFQRLFEAGARLITVTDELLQTILKL
jgi:flagellar hook-associated protein 1 FlgK